MNGLFCHVKAIYELLIPLLEFTKILEILSSFCLLNTKMQFILKNLRLLLIFITDSGVS